jgi:hypothetical protein
VFLASLVMALSLACLKDLGLLNLVISSINGVYAGISVIHNSL